ncbi:MAG: primosomal protein N' [Myxococcales bacterium]|nr:primosomal protein N' [Myxococcales bacterium]
MTSWRSGGSGLGGRTEALDRPCISCGSPDPLPLGAGTQRIAEEIREVVPRAKVLRLDRDVATSAARAHEVLGAFRRGDGDILVGTKMITKGHDFPRVTLVGIINADMSLAFPDFRAQELTFQLLTQVAGRAGRGDLPGRVIVQTHQVEHPIFASALAQDPDSFFRLESEGRRAAGYPPYGRIALVKVESEDRELAEQTANELSEYARFVATDGSRILGPAPAPIGRIQGKFRFRFLILSDSASSLSTLATKVATQAPARQTKLSVIIDVDAQDFL